MAVVYEATIMSDYIDLFKTYLNGSITTTNMTLYSDYCMFISGFTGCYHLTCTPNNNINNNHWLSGNIIT